VLGSGDPVIKRGVLGSGDPVIKRGVLGLEIQLSRGE
jgi:hypothetical protein